MKTLLEDPSSVLRYELGALGADLPARGQAQQQIMLEIINAAYPAVSLNLEYFVAAPTGPAKRVVSFPLPMTLACFDEALSLSGPDLLVRWNALVNPGQEAIDTFPAPAVTPAVAHKVLTGAAKFSYVEGVVDTSVGVIGAATLRMGSPTAGDKVNVGCLLKIEIAAGQVRVTARTTHATVSAPLVSTIKALLLASPQ